MKYFIDELNCIAKKYLGDPFNRQFPFPVPEGQKPTGYIIVLELSLLIESKSSNFHFALFKAANTPKDAIHVLVAGICPGTVKCTLSPLHFRNYHIAKGGAITYSRVIFHGINYQLSAILETNTQEIHIGSL